MPARPTSRRAMARAVPVGRQEALADTHPSSWIGSGTPSARARWRISSARWWREWYRIASGHVSRTARAIAVSRSATTTVGVPARRPVPAGEQGGGKDGDPRPAYRVKRGDDCRREGVEVAHREIRLTARLAGADPLEGRRRVVAPAHPEGRPAQLLARLAQAHALADAQEQTGDLLVPEHEAAPVLTPSWRAYACSHVGQASPESGWCSVGWRTATGTLNECHRVPGIVTQP